jgi:hypothetical protein
MALTTSYSSLIETVFFPFKKKAKINCMAISEKKRSKETILTVDCSQQNLASLTSSQGYRLAAI